MRNLTIRRTKSFIACLAKMRVYIEDPINGDLLISNTRCRRIGEVKNGEEKTFEITSEAAKVFVIADKLSRNFCNEYYQLDEGEEDVVLSGRNVFNPASGNAFRFDNNSNADAIANRKKGTKTGVIILIAAAIVGFVIGLAVGFLSVFDSEPMTFSKDGMSITVTDDFIVDDSIEYYTLALGSDDVAIFALKEKFDLFDDPDSYTLEEYGELVIDANGFDTTLKNKDGLLGFEHEFTNTAINETFRYFSYVYESDDSFWLIQFAVSIEDVEEYEESITEWAKSVTFE